MQDLLATSFGDLPAAWATVVAALLAGLVAAISLAVNATSGRRDRRRNLYSEAYRATMSWVEMAYRAHHAAPDDHEFLAKYHKLWEDLRYYAGWLLFESPQLGYSYARFKEAVERVCDEYIEGTPSRRRWLLAPRFRGFPQSGCRCPACRREARQASVRRAEVPEVSPRR